MKSIKRKNILAIPFIFLVITVVFACAFMMRAPVAAAQTELYYGGVSGMTGVIETVSFASYQQTSYYNNHNFPSYYNTDSNLTNVCAPVAGANVIGYYDRNFPNLFSNWASGYTANGIYRYYPLMPSNVTYIQGGISALYTSMGTNSTGNGTTRTQYQTGLSSYVQSAGYNISYTNLVSGGTFNVSSAKTQLVSGKVITLFLNGYTYTAITSLTSTGATYSHNTYTGTHVAIAYGYLELSYYDSANNLIRTDTFLRVATGQQGNLYNMIWVNSTYTTIVAADATYVY